MINYERALPLARATAASSGVSALASTFRVRWASTQLMNCPRSPLMAGGASSAAPRITSPVVPLNRAAQYSLVPLQDLCSLALHTSSRLQIALGPVSLQHRHLPLTEQYYNCLADRVVTSSIPEPHASTTLSKILKVRYHAKEYEQGARPTVEADPVTLVQLDAPESHPAVLLVHH